MNLIALATSYWGPPLVMFFCRVFPCWWIQPIAKGLSSHLARRRDIPFVKALRANMAVVHGLPEEHPEVEQVVAELLYNTIISYADFFRAVQAGPEKARIVCELGPAMRQTIQECLASDKGLVLVGAHMCSFDILLLGLRDLFPSVQVLSNADPQGSSQVMNRIREENGLVVTPISVCALRQAVVRLREGGVVAIAADLPVDSGEDLVFFGQESQFPVGHTRLALGTGARVLVGVSHRVGEGAYRAEIALAPRPESSGDRKQDVIHWAQDALTTMESFIRRWPAEWLMPTPVWSG